MEKTLLKDTIVNTLQTIDELTNRAERQIAQYIKEHFSGRINFDDFTGYPIFQDYTVEEYQTVVSVKVNEDNEILFNTDIDMENKVDENGWFRPRDYGCFDLNNLADVILNL